MQNMLGEQIAELKGKITGQRVLDAEDPSMETTISAKGSFKGTQVIDTLTFVSSPSTEGVIHGRGRGVLISVGTPEMVTYTGQGVGRISSSSATKWLGAHFYRTSSNGKLAFLNNIVAILEAEIDTEGNLVEKIWEWK
jgi:hypothetical protein